MNDMYNVIISPLQTEKSTSIQAKENKYLFVVSRDANKIQVKKAVEEIYKVSVKSVNTQNILGKMRRVRREEGKRPDWKKAIVTLKKGEVIDLK